MSRKHRLILRPRAGLAATAVLFAGLAGSAGAALIGGRFVEPASAQTERTPNAAVTRAAARTEMPSTR